MIFILFILTAVFSFRVNAAIFTVTNLNVLVPVLYVRRSWMRIRMREPMSLI